MFKKLKFFMLLAVLGLTVNANAQYQEDLPSSGDWNTQTINTTQTVNLTGDVSVTGVIIVTGRRTTLTININSTNSNRYIRRASSNDDEFLFEVENGAELVINGNPVTKHRIIIDSKAQNSDTYYKGSCFRVAKATLKLDYVRIQNLRPQREGNVLAIWAGRNNNNNDSNTLTITNTTFADCGTDINPDPGHVKSGSTLWTDGGCTTILTMTNDSILRCKASNGFGGVLSNGGPGSSCEMIMTDCYAEGNYSSGWGGAILWSAGDENSSAGFHSGAHITNCTFKNNQAQYLGGAISSEGTVYLKDNKFIGNHAKSGGALDVLPFTLSGGATSMCGFILEGGNVFEGNYSDCTSATFEAFDKTYPAGGGAIFCILNSNNATLTLDVLNETFKGNYTQNEGNGGAILIKKDANGSTASLTIGNGTVGPTMYNNYANRGGAIALINADLTFKNGNVYENGYQISGSNEIQKTELGGAIYVEGEATFMGGTIKSNRASESGGGIYLNSNATLTMSGTSQIVSNSVPAGKKGGGVYMGGTMNAGAGDFTVRYNKSGTSDNDVYLPKVQQQYGSPTSKYITVSNEDFHPIALGIYTELTISGSTRRVNVLYNNDVDVISAIYSGMIDGSYNIYDDRHQYQPAISNDKRYIVFVSSPTTPWSLYQQQITGEPSASSGVYQIGNAKDLTAFLAMTNKVNIGSYTPTSAKPDAKAVLTDDIHMEGQYWVPIGTSDKPFTGTFDGQGHTISGLTMTSGNPSDGRGLFGTVNGGAVIKNLVLTNITLEASGNMYMGTIACKMTGGDILNCMAGGTIVATNRLIVAGGLVGQNNGGKIENNCCTVGFTVTGTMSGGLVGENIGTGSKVNNCYVRTVAGSLPSYLLAHSNSATMVNCFGNDGTELDQTSSGSVPNCGTFTPVVLPYTFNQADNMVDNNRLVDILNRWVEGSHDSKDGATEPIYASWVRPYTSAINDGYPLLKTTGNAVVKTTDGELQYGDINDLISTYNIAGNTLLLFGNKDGVSAFDGTKANLYIDENAALTTANDITAYTSQGLPPGGNWHLVASPLQDCPTGYVYDGPVENTTISSANTELNFQTFLPKYIHRNNADFYTFYEPDYHWVNLRRSKNDHWHDDFDAMRIDYYYNDADGYPVTYYNDNKDGEGSKLVSGKGYLLRLDENEGVQGVLQAGGTLNKGDVEVHVSKLGDYLNGYNLLGNPYQSYLNFSAFAGENSNLWTNGHQPFYLVLENNNFYKQGTTARTSEGSEAASGIINMHQGFFIVTDVAGTAMFTDRMRTVNAGGAHFREERPTCPLVNLMVTDGEGVGDIAVVEFDRPEYIATPKMMGIGGNGKVYFRHNGADCALLFLDERADQLSVGFDASENGTYAMTWSTANAEFSYLHLIDNMTGTDIDMFATSEYRFTASTEDYKLRFKLKFAYTGVGEHAEDESTETFAFMHGGSLSVSGEGILNIIDMQGRVIATERVSGPYSTVNLPVMAQGVYVLRLVSGDSVKTQKIVKE